jgi:DNA-binding GntR family transcriptional regulator
VGGQNGSIGNGSSSRWERAYTLIRQRIADGTLTAGDHVGESDLAQALGLSRTPIREALKMLQAEGMLVASPSRGLTVAQLSVDQASQLFYFRETVEGLAARLSALHAKASEIDAMAACLEREAAMATADADALLGVNDEFHRIIHSASRNMYVVQAMKTYQSGLLLLRSMTKIRFTPSAQAHEQHRAIFLAIEREDQHAAEEAMRVHIRMSRRKRLELLERGGIL